MADELLALCRLLASVLTLVLVDLSRGNLTAEITDLGLLRPVLAHVSFSLYL